MIQQLLRKSVTLQVTFILSALLLAIAVIFSHPAAPDWLFPIVAGAGCTAVVAVGVRRDLKASGGNPQLCEETPIRRLQHYGLNRGALMLALPLKDVMIVDGDPQLVLIPLEKIVDLLPEPTAVNNNHQRPSVRRKLEELTGESIAKALGA